MTLDVRGLSVRFGPLTALDDFSLSVAEGSIVGLIGPNGAGKTTAVDAITGFTPPARGEITLTGRRIEGVPAHRRVRLGLARTFQGLELFEDLAVTENLAVATEACRTPSGRPDLVSMPVDERDQTPATLDHEHRARLALARALATRPRVLLLDEPAAGLGPQGRAELARTLRALAADGLGILLVEHDTALVFDVCDEVCVLDFGRIIARGTPAEVRDDPAVRAAYLGISPSGHVSGRPGDHLRDQNAETVLQVHHLSAGYGAVPVLHDVSLDVRAGEVLALLGANGAGKTTTLLVASGVVVPTAGTVRAVGRPVAGRPDRVAQGGVAHAAQDRGVLPGLTVAENLRLGGRGDGAAIDEALSRFPALRPLWGRRGGQLSGGEQQLLSLARAVAGRPRLLLVDEPSLGLGPALVGDVLAALRALADEAGTAVVVVEQHPYAALVVADRAVVMAGGRIVLEGDAAELAAQPEALEAAYLGGR